MEEAICCNCQHPLRFFPLTPPTFSLSDERPSSGVGRLSEEEVFIVLAGRPRDQNDDDLREIGTTDVA